MTFVREFKTPGAIRVAFGSALGAALKGHDQSLISYVRFDEAAGIDWLIAFEDEANDNAENWSSFGKEGGGGNLAWYPGAQGLSPAGGVWGLAVATWKQSTAAYHFYFYNFNTLELESLGTGTFTLAWGATNPKRVQFGLWDAFEEFNGRYAGAAIFGKALSAGEIEALAKAKSLEAWASSGPAALWIFDQEGSGEKVTDLMGHGADQGSIPQGGSTNYLEVAGGLPLPLREGEEAGEEEPEEHPGAEAPTFVGVKTESGLEPVTRYVKTEAGLVEV